MNIDKLIKRKQRAKRDGNLRQLAEMSKMLGDTYFESERSKEALQEYTEQLSVCESLQDKLNSAIAHRMIGEVHASLGDYEQALVHQNLHLEGAKEMRNAIEEQRAFATLGRTHFCLAESLTGRSSRCKHTEALASAKMAYARSMELCDRLTESEIKLEEKLLMRARLLLNLGLTLEAQKETQQAVDLIEQATALCVANNFQEDLHRACISLAGIYERQGNRELALKYIETAGTVNDVRLKAEAEMSRAELLMRSGQWIRARKALISLYTSSGLPRDNDRWVEKYLRIVVTLCRAEDELLLESDTRAEQKLCETLGDASVAVQCFEKGVEYYRRMLACAEKTEIDVGVSLISLARTLKDAGRYEEALPYAQRELELCTSPRERCRSALFLADLSSMTGHRIRPSNVTDETETRAYYALALSSANESEDDVRLRRSVTRELVAYLESTGQFDEARDVEREAGLSLEAASDTESEASSGRSDEIGADVCLEDLSDLENDPGVVSGETSAIEGRGRRRGPRGKMASARIRRNEKGETQLHVACINGDIGAVERLLLSGHSTNVRDHCGWSPLHEAANHGYVDIAELLLKYDANINDPGGASCKGVTPLHDAACCGHLSMMQLLMRHGACLTLKTHDGDTVLDCLEDWRNRVDDLSPADSMEYDAMRRKLSAVIPITSKRRERCDKPRTQASESLVRRSPVSAGEDYKRTIANLRRFNKGNRIAAFKNNDEPRAALLNEEEVLIDDDDDDDWLEDDIGSAARRKSTASDGRIERTNVRTTTKKRSTDGNTQCERGTKRLKLNNALRTEQVSEDASEASDDVDDATAILGASFEEMKREAKRKRQTSLISGGFTVSRTPSPVGTGTVAARLSSPLQSGNVRSTETHVIRDPSEYVHLCARVTETTLVRLKVEVCEDEQQFLTRVTTAAECTFFRETGCTVRLVLRPINGRAATMESILRIARQEASDARIECEIVELEIPPVVERYRTICRTYDTAPCETALKCLKSCENTSMFRVPKPDEIDTKESLLVPLLLKTLAYERNVKLLQLSGTALLTAGQHLHRCLSNLSSLQELRASGCDIDFACLRQINSLPPQLRVLDLSYNPLSPKSCDTLQKLIAPLRCLRSLDLRYCGLENFSLPLDNPNLTHCDVSWNKLNRDATTSFLSKQLFDLNLSNVLLSRGSSNSSLDATGTVLSASLESLELSFCDITDTDVTIILAQLPRLSRLTLCGNTKVSVLSVDALLSRRPTLTHIDVSGCETIASDPGAELVIQNPETCTLLVSMEPDVCDAWLKLWRTTAVVTRLPHNLAIFKPI